MMNLPPLILASASPRRAELMERMGLTFSVLPSAAEEVWDKYLSPHELCQLNAYRKARAVAKKHLDHLVLGADTLVCLGNRRMGKPANRGEARKMLTLLSGKTHQVVTGVCLLHLRHHRQLAFAVSSAVVFRTLTRAMIDEYLRQVETIDKAGAYAIQEHGALIIEEHLGSFDNIVGLPTERLGEVLAQFSMNESIGQS